MEQNLATDIAVLENQLVIFKNDLVHAVTEGQKSALQAEIETVINKISQKREQVAAVETDIQAAQTSIMGEFDRIEVEGQVYSLRDFTINEQFAQVLSYWFQLKVGEVAQQYSVQAQSYKHENEDLKADLSEKEARINLLLADNDRLGLANADLQSKRDAAADTIEEHEQTIKRLQDDVNSLRESTAPKPIVTNMSGSLGEMMKAALATRPAIYNVHWKDENNRKTYVANKADTGEEIEFGYLNLGKYNVIQEEEVSQFRKAPEPIEAPVLPDIPEVNLLIPFQGYGHLSEELDDATQGEQFDPTLERAPRTIEERLDELQIAVFGEVRK